VKGFAARIVGLLLLVLGTMPMAALAQPAAYTANCTGGGCHVSPTNPFPVQLNGANSSSVVQAAISAGMTGNPSLALTGPEMTAIIGYSNGSLTSATLRVFQFQTGNSFDLHELQVPSPYAGLNNIVTTSGPTHGTVSYTTGFPPKFTYTPAACYVGPDSFSFQGVKTATGIATSSRTQTVSVSNPTTGPTINTAAPPGGQTGVAYNHTVGVSACPLLATYAVTSGALPPGLTLNATSGIISGTPTALGTFNGQITASYTGGAASTPQNFSITIALGPPVITSASPAPNSSVGVAYTGYTITATNPPHSAFGASGLPPGLVVDPSTGAITGTPTSAAGSPYSASVSATNANSTGNKTVVFNVVPAINSASAASGQTGVAFSYQVTAAPGPAFTSYAALDPLPAGLVLGAGTGTITGTPTVVGGPTNVRLTGSNAFGTSAQFTLAITIGLGPPVITSALAASGGEAIAFTPYQITATNPPHSSFNATGLPSGLVVDTTTGIVSGTPASGSAGVYPVTISATNATATGNATLTITISQFAPVNTSLVAPAGQTGVPYSFQITANNGPTSFNAANLPPGLTVNTGTGLISGIPTAVGVFNTASITSSNGSGSDTDVVPITITLGPPVISCPATAGGAVGFPFTYQVVATNGPTLFAISNIPPGLTFTPGTGLLTGTPTTNGIYAGTMSATNATATATVPLTITIAVGIPVVTSASVAAATGVPFSYQVVATNGPTSYAATGLPAGLTINPASGRITGTPAVSGTFNVNLGATNATGTGTGVLTLAVTLSPPSTGNPGDTVNVLPGQSFQYQVAAQNGPFTFTATGLPAGLTLDPASGIINGTVGAVSGTYDVAITITNASGTTTFNLRIIVGFVIARVADVTVDVPFETATPVVLPVSGSIVTVNIVTLPAHGLLTTQPGSGTVVYAPAAGYSGFDTFSYSITNPAGTSASATVTVNVGTAGPVAGGGAITVQLNTPLTIDMAKLVRGSSLTGVAITVPPLHGSAAVNGLSVTYSPRTDYFGPDSFTYVAFGNAGSSAPASIQVEVVGRPDPSADREVLGLVDAQSQAARRFSSAQVGNYQRRMESLHRSEQAAGPLAAVAAQRVAGGRSERAPLLDRIERGPDEPAPLTGMIPAGLVNTLVNAVTSRSFDVSAGTGGGAGAGGFASETSLWVAGTANFGDRDATGERGGLRFSTDGMSAGVDRRLAERFTAGVGVGYGRDETEVGSNSRLKASGGSIAVYGSYQPTARTYVDMLLGYGRLRFDMRRFVEPLDGFANARRKGTQAFGSVAAGYEHRRGNLLVSPYGRIDFSAERFDAVDESGVGDYGLRYAESTQRSTQAAVGIRAESKHETEFGFAAPRARVEYRRELQAERATTLSYADLLGGPQYTVTPAGSSRNSLLLGVGADLVFRGGLRIGVDWTAQRQSGTSNVQGVRVLLTQELDGRAMPGWRWEPTTFSTPVNVDGGFSWDDNVTRGREDADRRADRIFSLGLSTSRPFRLGANTRLVATALANGEKLDRNAALGRFAAGGQGEVQYRTSGAFDAMTFGFVGRAMYERYESSLRTGPRYFVGVNARRAITDRIELFAEVGGNARDGRSDVFRWRDWSAKVNVDWSLGPRGLVYLTGEYRRGDTVSSGHPSLLNLALADVFVADDAFEAQELVAYRFDARTLIGTLGYNLPLGARDSLDFSWRRIEATPTRRPSFDFSGPLRYQDNQYSLVYLMRF
jgi:uncharacterized protein YhjY with autotransporter beta-barrel domain